MDFDEGPRWDIRDLVREVAEAREHCFTSLLEASLLCTFNADLKFALTTLPETVAKAQGEAAEDRAKEADLERDLVTARRGIADMRLRFDNLESRLHTLENTALCTVNMM